MSTATAGAKPMTVGRRRVVAVRSGGRDVCERCAIAATPVARMRGLLGRTSLAAGDGLLLDPSPSVHTFFMRFDIDVVFLDRDLRVLKVVQNLAPWRASGCRGARLALELAAGEAARNGIHVGDSLELVG